MEITKGVKDLRATAPNLAIAVYTVPKVVGRVAHTERAVSALHDVIWMLDKERKFKVIDMDREVRSVGRWQVFSREIIQPRT